MDEAQVYFRLTRGTTTSDTKTFTINFRIASSALWSNAYIQYLATSSELLTAGTFSAISIDAVDSGVSEDGDQILKFSKSVSLTASLDLKNRHIAYAFISGLRTPNRFINLKLASDPDYYNGILTVALLVTPG